jgi:uncharacterized membrane protein HdeD (DUF308 family)
MSSRPLASPLLAGIHKIRSSWGWFLALGIALILLGAACIIGDVTATFVTVLAFGWFLMISGIVALVHAFRIHTWQGFFLYLLSAVFRGFAGYALIRYPLAGAVGLTLVLSAFFIVGGLSRAIGATVLRFPRWGWTVFSGVVAVVLGVMLLEQLPLSSIWFIGFAIGLDMILEGTALIGIATAIRSLPEVVTYGEKAA